MEYGRSPLIELNLMEAKRKGGQYTRKEDESLKAD